MNAECAWGFGPDVLLTLEADPKGEFPLVLLARPQMLIGADHGYCAKASVGLSSTEARALAASLIMAAETAEAADQALFDRQLEVEDLA